MKWIARYSAEKTYVRQSEEYLLLGRVLKATGTVALLSLKARGTKAPAWEAELAPSLSGLPGPKDCRELLLQGLGKWGTEDRRKV